MNNFFPLIAGNWKMYKGVNEARGFAEKLVASLSAVEDREIVVFPPFTSLSAVAAVLRGTNIAYGAQNVFWESQGAFTGEVSPAFLAELGCRYVIIGHSERRGLFGETNEQCARKIKAVLKYALRPILCCGETLKERAEGRTFAVIEEQLTKSLAGLPPGAELDIAYEPVWAIGTGRNATPAQAQEVHNWIRNWLRENHREGADRIRVIYGGSVKPENVDALMGQPEVDGVLVGGASLEVDSFVRIVNYQK